MKRMAKSSFLLRKIYKNEISSDVKYSHQKVMNLKMWKISTEKETVQNESNYVAWHKWNETEMLKLLISNIN